MATVLCYFKTSHVIVYLRMYSSPSITLVFQNISCYCLSCYCLRYNLLSWISKHLMLLFIRSRKSSKFTSITFQNISCYCLSAAIRAGYSVKTAFQNISCYCLSSDDLLLRSSSQISKHLMLLFIIFQGAFLFHEFHFKTSHVIVYPISQG